MDPTPEVLATDVSFAANFRSFFESAPGLFLVVQTDDPVFTMVAASDALLSAVRHTREQLIGKGLFDVFARPNQPIESASLDNLLASFRRVMAAGRLESMHVQRYDIPAPDAADGEGTSERYWTTVNSPVLNSAGQVEFIIHRIEDVTDYARLKQIESDTGKLNDELRLRADHVESELVIRGAQLAETKRLMREWQEATEKLSESENRFRLAFAEAPVGMVLTTVRGEIVEINQVYLDMLGYSREELTQRDTSSFTHPDDNGPTKAFLSLLLNDPNHRGTIEKRYIRKSGELLWARASAALQMDAQGRPGLLIAVIEDITTRKQAEEQLRESRERLRAIYDGAYDYMGLLSPDGKLLEANRASLEFARNTRDEVVGRPFWETPWFIHTPGAPEAIQNAVQRASAGEFVSFEATLQRPVGGALTFDISFHPVRDESGNVVLIVPQGREITERRNLELRNAFLVRLDDATRPLTDAHEITQTAARLLGEYLGVNRCAYADVEADENTFNLTGDYTWGVSSIVGRYTFDQFGAECLRLMRADKPYVVEDSEADYRTQEKLTSYRMTQIRAVICVPLRKAGRFVAALAVHQTSPRVWTQDEVDLVQLVAGRCWESIERAHVARELRTSEQRRRLSQRAGRIGSFEWLIQEDRVVWTPELEALYGVPEGTFEGTYDDWRKRVVPEDAHRIGAEIRNCLAKRQTDYVYEFQAVLPDGTLRWLRGQAQFSYDSKGSGERMLGVNLDITEQKRSEEELRRINRELEEFAYVASHDLQEPLRMVNIYTQLILKQVGQQNETVNWYASFVSQGVGRMEALIKDLLTFSRTVHTEDPPSNTADLSTALNEAMSVLRSRIEDSDALVTASALPAVRGDTAQLAHVFQNVISNSLKYRRADTRPQIRISSRQEDGFIIVSMVDNGIGFEPEYAERIFGLFKRLHKDEYPGTGLGLAICKRIIERHGGRIWAEAKPNVGAAFHFSLPAADG